MGNYLFILEGTKDEPKLFNSLFREMKKDDRQRCYFFRCNLHALANLLMPNADDDLDGIDLLMALKGRENSNEETEVLNHRYTDIFLVFDFELQEDRPAFEKICKMVAYFDDSTNNGKLYINYPMMQSYRHFAALPDPGFEYREAVANSAKRYKQLAEEEGKAIPSGLQSYNHIQLYAMAVHHLKKREKVLGRPYELPDQYDEHEDKNLFDIQNQKRMRDGSCFVLNTSILLLVAYAPKRFINEVKRHPDSYPI